MNMIENMEDVTNDLLTQNTHCLKHIRLSLDIPVAPCRLSFETNDIHSLLSLCLSLSYFFNLFVYLSKIYSPKNYIRQDMYGLNI